MPESMPALVRPDDERPVWFAITPAAYWGVHLACFGAFFTGVSAIDVALCVSLYWIRIFAITAGYHRYFAHRTYKTSRAFQLMLAFIGGGSMQKGVLWWAMHHRDHHRTSDTEQDIHSPRKGFIWSHCLWFLCTKFEWVDYDRISDFSRYPELRFLDRFHALPMVLLGVLCFAVNGLSGLVWGLFISTVLVCHATFTINSLAHVFGSQRYDTGDTSKNNFWLALLTMGEGWHNNHHHYQSATNQGFFWWEIDLTYTILKMLSWLGVVWDLRTPPDAVLRPAPAAPATEPATVLAASVDKA